MFTYLPWARYSRLFQPGEGRSRGFSVVVKTMNRLQHQFYCLLGHAATRPDDGLMSLIILTAAPSAAALEHTPAQHIVCVLWHSVSNTDIDIRHVYGD